MYDDPDHDGAADYARERAEAAADALADEVAALAEPGPPPLQGEPFPLPSGVSIYGAIDCRLAEAWLLAEALPADDGPENFLRERLVALEHDGSGCRRRTADLIRAAMISDLIQGPGPTPEPEEVPGPESTDDGQRRLAALSLAVDLHHRRREPYERVVSDAARFLAFLEGAGPAADPTRDPAMTDEEPF